MAELRVHLLPAREIEARERRDRLSSGTAALDRLLGGGWPRGALSLVRGARGQGRTAVMLTSLAAALRAGYAAALIDFGGALDPAAAARAGVPLERLLWVRGGTAPRPLLTAAEAIVSAGGFGLLALDFGEQAPPVPTAAWLRLRRLVAAPGTAVLVVAARPLVNLTGATTAVSLQAAEPRFNQAAEPRRGAARAANVGEHHAPALLSGLEVQAQLLRGGVPQDGGQDGREDGRGAVNHDGTRPPRLTLVHRPE